MAIPEQELTGREKSTASQAVNSTYRSGHIGVFELKTPGKKQEFKEKASTQEKTLKIVNQGKKKNLVVPVAFVCFFQIENTQSPG